MPPLLRKINIGTRTIAVSEAYDTYWRFAAKRQDVFMRRYRGKAAPWTDDVILREHRFTNVYRASDRVSQFLIRHVIYGGNQAPQEVIFRILLFKIFNKIETWQGLVSQFGAISWASFELHKYEAALSKMKKVKPIYAGAYIMPCPQFGLNSKHANHLKLISTMMTSSLDKKVMDARRLESIYRTLLSYPSMGSFLAFQFAIDINYSALTDLSEMEFVVAGPGAKSGIKKCFLDTGGLRDEDIIRYMTDNAESEFERLGLKFETLWGRRLQLIDCQNLFCEVNKYCRVAHPDLQGEGRTKIKQRFVANHLPAPQWYPPKWGICPTPVMPQENEHQVELPLSI